MFWLIFILVLILVLIVDYVTAPGQFNEYIDRWLLRTLWLWLPFFALITLTKDLIARSQTKK